MKIIRYTINVKLLFTVHNLNTISFIFTGNAQKYFVSSGTITVNNDSSAQILAEEAQPLENFDAEAVRRTAETARQALATAADEADKAEAQIQVDTCEALMHALEGK